jgi:hypothetical protein
LKVDLRQTLRTGWVALLRAASVALLVVLGAPAALCQGTSAEDDAIAQSLAEMLRDARAIVSDNQSRINDPELGDKGLTADVVIEQAIETYKKNTGVDPLSIDPASRHSRLLRAMMGAIREVRHQSAGDQRQGDRLQGLHSGRVWTARCRVLRTPCER